MNRTTSNGDISPLPSLLAPLLFTDPGVLPTSPLGCWMVRGDGTSSTGLGAGGPALECPLLQKHIVAPNLGQQVLMDEVLVGQAAAGATLHQGERLRGDGKEMGLQSEQNR